MNKLLKRVSFACVAVLFSLNFISCSDDDNDGNETVEVPNGSFGTFILDQGEMKKDYCRLDFEWDDNGRFFMDNKISKINLGSTGQDLLVFGSKLYVSLWGSGTIHVINLESRTTEREIQIKDEKNEGRAIQNLVSYGDKVYATTGDGHVVSIDTLLLKVDKIVEVGPTPVGIDVYDGKLFVANSDAYSSSGDYSESSIAIVDIATMTVEKRLSSSEIINPYFLQIDKYGNVYVNCFGNYMDIPASFLKLTKEGDTYQISKIGDIAVSNFLIQEDICYYYYVAWDENGNPGSTFGRYNISDDTIQDGIFSDNTAPGIKYPYALGIHPRSGDFYVSECVDNETPGNVYVYGKAGNLKRTFKAGIYPCKFAFYYN